MAATADDAAPTTTGPSGPSNPSGTAGTETGTGRQPAPRRRGGGRIAAAIGFFGELLITAGVVLGLFVAYSLWWTNVVADREADRQGDAIRDTWAHEPPKSAPGPAAVYNGKDGIGFLHVPALGHDEILVKKGTTTGVLNAGVAGYYTDPLKAVLPTTGKAGNFTLAAHRDGHGAKFHNIDKIKKGDPIVFETKDKWYVYKVYAILPETSKFNVEVLKQVPKQSGVKKPGHYITLTTCTPVYTSKFRYVVWGELERTDPVGRERTRPAELG
jgi:LPXTG-site transpeptidase (sortase) family protein